MSANTVVELQQRREAIIADENRFQRACGRYVERIVLHRVTSLMSDIVRNAEAAADIFGLDMEDIYDWAVVKDYEDVATIFIMEDADLSQLESIADQYGYWDDLLADIGYNLYASTCEDLGTEPEDLESWLNGQDECHSPEESFWKALRQAVLDLVVSADGAYAWVGREFDLEPYEYEVYEYWAIDRCWAEDLTNKGELVFEFADFTIWGRCTTGQAIKIDGVIRKLVKELDEHAWVWVED